MMESKVKISSRPLPRVQGWEILLQVFPQQDKDAYHGIYLAQFEGPDALKKALTEAREVLKSALSIIHELELMAVEEHEDDD